MYIPAYLGKIASDINLKANKINDVQLRTTALDQSESAPFLRGNFGLMKVHLVKKLAECECKKLPCYKVSFELKYIYPLFVNVAHLSKKLRVKVSIATKCKLVVELILKPILLRPS